MLCYDHIMCVSVSHVLELIESGLHRINIVALGCGGLGSDGVRDDISLSRHDLPTSFHGLLVTHLSQEVHDLAVVDGSRVDVVKGSVHVTCLNIHVFEDSLKAADAASDTQRVHLLHASLQHWDGLLDLSRNLLGPVSGLQLGS